MEDEQKTSGSRRSSAYKAAMGRSAESVMNGSKSGLLYKQGHKVKNWKRRWFSLCDKRLYYFEPAHSGDARPYGVVLLDGYIVELVDDPKLKKKIKRDTKGITLFRLWHPRKPEYLLCADSEAEMEEWIGAILIEQHRHQANRLTVVQDMKPSASSRNRVAHQSAFSSDNGATHQPRHTDVANGRATDSTAFPSSRRDLLPHRRPPPVPTSATPPSAASTAVSRSSDGYGGVGQAQQQLRCAKCGAAAPSDAAPKFCRDCGTLFAAGSAPPLPNRVNGSTSSSTSATAPPPLPHRMAPPLSYSAVAAAPPLPLRQQSQPYKAPRTFIPSPATTTTKTTASGAVSAGPPLPSRTSPSHTPASALSPRRTPPTQTPALQPARAAPAVPLSAKPTPSAATQTQPSSTTATAPPPAAVVRPAPAVPVSVAPAPAVPKRLSPQTAPTLVNKSNVRLSAFGGPAVGAKSAYPPPASTTTPPSSSSSATSITPSAAVTSKPAQPRPTAAAPVAPAVAVKTVASPTPAPAPAVAAPSVTATPAKPAAKPDQREQMRQAIQVQAAREKEMRQKVMQRMNEKQELKKNQQQEQQRQQHLSGEKQPVVPSEVKNLSDKLTRIEDELRRASDTQILKGKGAELNDSLKALKDDILRARQKHPQVTGDLVERYNKLSKTVPARVNEVFAVQNNSQNAQQRPPVKAMNADCSKCGSKLEGDVVEVAGMHFHRGCFGCAGCGRKLERSCLNIGDKPYCDSCGKQAFIRHTLAK